MRGEGEVLTSIFIISVLRSSVPSFASRGSAGGHALEGKKEERERGQEG